MLSDTLKRDRKIKPYSDEGKNWIQKRKGSLVIGGVLLFVAALIIAWPFISGADTPSKIIAPGHSESPAVEQGF